MSLQKAERFFNSLHALILPCSASLAPGYCTELDVIRIQPVDNYIDPRLYYEKLAHEFVHWTRHPSRLNRMIDVDGEVGYSFEEVIAELGTVVLLEHLGLKSEKYIRRASNYLAGWALNCSIWEPTTVVERALPFAKEAAEFIIKKGNLHE